MTIEDPKDRIPRTLIDQVSSLDDHLFVLRDHLKIDDRDDDGNLIKSSAHVKVLAGTLRTLVCDRPGLLFSLAKKLGVDDRIGMHVAGRFDREHPLVKDMVFGFVSLRREGEGDPKLPPHQHRLSKVLKSTDAFWVGESSYTHEQVIRTVAQQIGTSHEDAKISPGLAKIRNTILNGEPSYVTVVEGVADLVLELGETVLLKAERDINYQRRKHSSNFGDMSIVLTASGRQRHLFGHHLIGSFRSAISRAAINLYVSNDGIVFGFERNGKGIFKGSAPFPIPWSENEVFAFSAFIRSSAGAIEIYTNDDLKVSIDSMAFGWVFGEDFKFVPYQSPDEILSAPCLMCWSRCLRRKDIANPLRFSPLGALTDDCVWQPVFQVDEDDG